MKNHYGRTYFDEFMPTCLRGAVFLRHSVYTCSWICELFVSTDFRHCCCCSSHKKAAKRHATERQNSRQANESDAVGSKSLNSYKASRIAAYDIWSQNSECYLKIFYSPNKHGRRINNTNINKTTQLQSRQKHLKLDPNLDTRLAHNTLGKAKPKYSLQ